MKGQATYQFYRSDTADRQINSTDLSRHLEQASMLHIGSLALTGDLDGEQWCQLFERAKSRVFTSVDLNIRPRFVNDTAQYRKRLKRVMKSAQLIKLSDEDLEWWSAQGVLSDEEQFIQCQKLWQDYQPKILILTRGSSGSSLWFDNESILRRIDTPVVPVRNLQDTVGAGDTFMGSFLALLQQILDKLTHISQPDMIKILDFASTAASLNCERTGCQPPSLDQVLTRLAVQKSNKSKEFKP